MRSSFGSALRLCLCLSTLSAHALGMGAGGAWAQTAPVKTQGPKSGPKSAALDPLAAQLASQNPDELRMGIETAASSRRAGTAGLVAARVREGLPADLLGPAIDALAALGDPKAEEVLIELSAHRRPAVRARALMALTMLHSGGAESALVKALSDQDEEVRKTAAAGLGEIGSKLALPALFRALERGVEGAAPALGKLAEASTVPRVTAYFGRRSFVTLTPILDALFTRRNLPEELKLSLVDAITRQQTAEARAYLEKISAELPPDAPPRLRKSITDALLRMPK